MRPTNRGPPLMEIATGTQGDASTDAAVAEARLIQQRLQELQHQQENTAAAFSYTNQPQSDTNWRSQQPPVAQPVMSTIGFGIDSSDKSSWDATEAAVRALRDAMERSTFRVPGTSRSPLQIHVKLGIPPKTNSSLEPMMVDTRTVTSLLPRSIPVLPLSIVVGGLAIPGVDPADPAICAAVACVTIQTLPSVAPQPAAQAQPSSPWAGLEQKLQQNASATSPSSQSTSSPAQPQQELSGGGSTTTSTTSRAADQINSMEMLALIARERIMSDAASANTTSVDHSASFDMDERECVSPELRLHRKKLQPGVTAKNNVRHFARHEYHDHSSEPFPEEEVSIFGNKLQMNAFPVKLHEALSQIEADGHGDVISWMPHGRSFKIHKQQDFLNDILPKYFVMTKKSSFLRQLNLYGFTRISVGPDKNSYYHELFLRGMRFLAHRIIRTRVNGHGIRSAADPESEPNFYSMPPVPLRGKGGHMTRLPIPRDVSEEETTLEKEEEEEDYNAEDDDSTCHKISPLISFPLKLQNMLDRLEAEGDTQIVSWQSHGRAFRVHDADTFVRELMPMFFRQTKYPSFQRQLHLYNFQRITIGRDKGAYYHEKCLRGMPHLCDQIKRTRVNGKGTRKPSNPLEEPNFYEMEPLPPIPLGSVVPMPMPKLEDMES